MKRLLITIGLLLAACLPAAAQGCGSDNPSCIVPTVSPATTSDNRAASTAFVQAALATGSVTLIPGITLVSGVGANSNGLLFDNAGTLGNLATANNGILATNGAGVPSIGTAIPNGVTATTQTFGDNTTKIATDAFVLANTSVCSALGAFSVGTGSGAQCSTVAGSVATLSGGPLTVNSTVNTLNKGLVTQQTSPVTGSVTGPLIYNSIATTSTEAVTLGATTIPISNMTNAWRTTLTTGGTNAMGHQIADLALLDDTIANGACQCVKSAIWGIAFSNKQDTSTGSVLLASDLTSWMASGSAYPVVGTLDLEVYVDAGATQPTQRTGLEIDSDGGQQATTYDTAIAVGNNAVGVAPFKTFVQFGSPLLASNTPVIDTGGSLFAATTSALSTIANVFNLPSTTVTGNILNFPHTVMPGAGGLVTFASTLPPNGPGGTIARLSAADASASILMTDSFGAGAAGGSYFLARNAAGTSASPSAIQSGSPIGGLLFEAYGTSQYSSNVAAIVAWAAQNFTNAANGTYLTLATTANGATTQTIRGRVENDGGLMWPDTVTGGSQGVGTINATGLYQGGVALYTAGTWSCALAGDGTAGTFTYVAQSCSYEKIGRSVFVRFDIVTSGSSGPTGNLTITGLPVASTSTTNDTGNCSFNNQTGWTGSAGYTTVAGFIGTSSTTILIVETGSGKTGQQSPLSEWVFTAGNIKGACNYRTN